MKKKIKKAEAAPLTPPLAPGLHEIELLEPWGDRAAGSRVKVDHVRAAAMIPAKARLWSPDGSNA